METGHFNSRIMRAISSAKAPAERPEKAPEPVEKPQAPELRRGFHEPHGKPENYPPPAPDEELLVILYRTMEEAVCFRHVFPPNFERKAMTFFGGLPLVPKSFVWPSGTAKANNGQHRSLSFSFLAQIDCRDLPAFSLRHLLPHSGTLYFFFDWGIAEGAYDGLTPFSNLVHYVPDDPADFSEATSPQDLTDCYDHNAGDYFRWLEHTDRSRGYPKTFPKWPVEPVVLRTFANQHPTEDDGNSAGRYQELWRAEQAASSIAAFGQPVSAARRFAPQDQTSVWRPAPGFPEAWISVEIFAGSFMRELQEKILRQQPTKTPDGVWPDDIGRLKAAYEQTFRQTESWIERARTAGLFAAVSDEERKQFWSWCETLHRSVEPSATARIHDGRSAHTLNSCINEAFQRGPGYCLSHSAEAAALVSDETLEAVRWRHSPLLAGIGGRGRQVSHQLMGAGTSIQGAPERFRDTHFLLMQFDSDYGMDWMWGDQGVLQYWITPDDLKARRFDRVIVTLEGH
jgi:uncharacterized protein YwqG